MILKVDNIITKCIIGGKDNLLPVNIEKELREYLRVRVEGYFRSPAYKSKVWDGYRNFITKDLRIATGFLPVVIPFLEELGVKIAIEDLRKNLIYFREDFTPEIGEWTLRDYQEPLVKVLNNHIQYEGGSLYFPRGILDAATNAGKTSVIAGIQNNLIGPRALMLVHRTELYDQAIEYFSTMYDVGEISSKRYRLTDFTIAMIGSLANKLSSLNVKRDMAQLNTLYVDETHRAGGDEFAAVLKEIGASVRVMVSGTPLENKDKVKNMLITAMSGKKLAKITNAELIEKGHSLRPIVHIKLNDTWTQGLRTYEAELESCVMLSQQRLEDMVEFIEARPGKKTLICFNELEHGEHLLKELTNRLSSDFTIGLLHGKLPSGLRKDALRKFKAGETNVLIGSTVLQEGVNIKDINNLIYAIAGKSSIRLKQFIGRLLRQDGLSEYVEILDWYDIGKYMAKHSATRLKIYQKEGFEVRYLYPHTKLGRPRK